MIHSIKLHLFLFTLIKCMEKYTIDIVSKLIFRKVIVYTFSPHILVYFYYNIVLYNTKFMLLFSLLSVNIHISDLNVNGFFLKVLRIT